MFCRLLYVHRTGGDSIWNYRPYEGHLVPSAHQSGRMLSTRRIEILFGSFESSFIVTAAGSE
jgi:hypothetical protein